MISGALARFSRRGFVGPRYRGFAGKLRFAIQEFIGRVEIVLIAEPASSLPEREPLPIELHFVETWAAFQTWLNQFDADYYPGYVANWETVFGWGEVLVLALLDGRVAGFGWLQRGTHTGLPCHYTRILEGEYRVLRVGVLPSFRRRGINTSFYVLLLRELFRRGATRVYIDCTRDNVPSLRAQIRAGFRPIGEIYVLGRLFGQGAIRWRPAAGLIDGSFQHSGQPR